MIVCATCPASAQVAESRPGRIATTTRLVKEFSELEQNLNTAIQRRDGATLNKLLSEDFEQWTPAPPGDPVAREQWMQGALDRGFALRSFEIRQMAVQMVNETAVVSFVQACSAICNGRDCSSNAFIVDLWQRQNGNPQLLVRYRCEISPREAGPSAPKPTGKE